MNKIVLLATVIIGTACGIPAAALTFVQGTGSFGSPVGPGASLSGNVVLEPPYLLPSPSATSLPVLPPVGIRWGLPVPSGGNKSGLRFKGANYAPAGVFIPTDGTPLTILNLFELDHINFPIQISPIASQLTGVTLNLSLSFLADDLITPIPVNAAIPITILETPNEGVCNPPGSPPCPDVITLTAPNIPVVQLPNSTEFINLELRFPSTGTNFIVTNEGQTNPFFIDGVFTRAPAPLPLGALGGLSLLSVKLRGLRKRYSRLQ